MKIKNYIANITCLILSLLLLFIFLEFSTRAYQSWRYDTPFFKSIGCYFDPELGWGGKKIFGNIKTDKIKIFFIGDSFTGGYQMEEKYMYYDILGQLLNAEVFVYAGGAYGTLQEYIALDEYFDSISPDLVVLQVCDNDFINNSWELEKKSFYFNQQMIRPYLINGAIQLRYPRDFGNFRKICCHSRFLSLLSNYIESLCSILAKKGLLHTIENDIEEKGLALKEFRRSVDITNEIILKIKNRTASIPLIAFAVDDREPYLEQFKIIFKQNNIDFFTSIPRAIKQKEQQGINLRLKDGHWNGLGQRICAQLLAKKLKSLNLKKLSY